jgi:hypothetical protein
MHEIVPMLAHAARPRRCREPDKGHLGPRRISHPVPHEVKAQVGLINDDEISLRDRPAHQRLDAGHLTGPSVICHLVGALHYADFHDPFVHEGVHRLIDQADPRHREDRTLAAPQGQVDYLRGDAGFARANRELKDRALTPRLE